MATALQQVHSANGSGVTSQAVNITSSLAASVLWAYIGCGATPTINLTTDSAAQTWTNIAPQKNSVTNQSSALMDNMLNTASGVTSVTGHTSASAEISITVQELTGTDNALDGSVPAMVTSSSTAAVPTAITTASGSILAAGVTDSGGSSTAYTVSPAAYTIDGLTPNGGNERIGSASAANVTAASHQPTFGLPAAADWVTGQAAYGVGAAGFDPSTVPWPVQMPEQTLVALIEF